MADDFLSSSEANSVRSLFDDKHAPSRLVPPLVCFSRGSPFVSLVEGLHEDIHNGGKVFNPEEKGSDGDVAASSPVVLVSDSSRRDGGAAGDRERVCFDTSRVGQTLAAELTWSTSTFVFPGESSLIDSVQQRLEDVFGLPRTHALATQLLKYAPGESYLAHTDCSLSLQVGRGCAVVWCGIGALRARALGLFHLTTTLVSVWGRHSQTSEQ